MFRMKINPQNVATFQSAIPKIVTTLILITFAYAIAGFMIDLMFVLFNLIPSVFQASGIITQPGTPRRQNRFRSSGYFWFFRFFPIYFILICPPRLISILSHPHGCRLVLI